MTTTIVHTTDLGPEDRTSLFHSVALARSAQAKLVSLHVNAPEDSRTAMLDASSVLAKWGDTSTTLDFEKQVHNCCDDPVDTVLDAFRTLKPSLVVASTRRRSNLARFFTGSDAEAIARNANVPTLLLPAKVRGFVDPESGTIDLHRVLVPIGDAEEAKAALEAATWIAGLAGAAQVEFILLHVGSPEQTPLCAPRLRPGWTTTRIDVEASSIEAATLHHAADASLIVMASRGHNSARDVVLGSHTERVLHDSATAILWVGV